MSLEKCQECGHEVSSSATQCPNCGAYVNKKSILITMIIVTIILCIVFGAILYYAWYNSDMQIFKRANERSRNEPFRFESGPAKLWDFAFFPDLTR